MGSLGKPCKRCARPIRLTWGRYCGTCRLALGIGLEQPKPGRGKRKYRDYIPSTDAMAHRVPGSFEQGKRR